VTATFCGGMAYGFNFSRSLLLSAVLIVFFWVLNSPNTYAARPTKPFDHSLWQQFLDEFVDEQGKIAFAAVKQDSSLLKQYLARLRKIEHTEFYGDWQREEQLALLLNAYHAGLVNLILEQYPIESTQDIPGFWDLPAVLLGMKSLSLNDMRSRELIERFEDEKIHTALSCAAESCPPFPRQAYTGPKVEGQLYVAAKKFVNDPAFIQINPGDKKIFLSRILKWYQSDFTLDFGQFDDEEKGKLTKAEKAVLSFVAYYLGDSQKLRYLEERNYRLDYLPFDWTLNDAAAPPAQS